MQAHELSSGRVESRQRPPVDRSQTVPAKILIPPEPVGGAWLRREVENAGRPVSFDSSNMGHMVDYRGNQDLDFRNTIPPRASQFTSFNTPGNAVMGSGMHGAAQSSAIRNERWHEHRSIGDDFRRMEQIEYLRHQQRQQSHLSSPQSPQSPHPSHPVQYFHESSQLLGAIQHTAPTVHAPAPVKAEDPHLKELVEELDQLFQMYCMHPVGKEVWDTLIQDADGLVDKFEMESRLQACELGLQQVRARGGLELCLLNYAGLDQVQQQVEEGKLEDMSISQVLLEI
ncbi:hypothetical protein GUITHDRAFT_117032 [Guillardia theta CCMP2712]|uniref:Uncharacterized protein n=1 Tax=Guillardia theta (strain CCMP2712) TaxID=905079 RepID=L1IKF8_GUITC|nr:hypothetical protein GUITHDRAFT_117032 [Guillardia theta CCMP2712]EKX36733.1 hypothetical protein GUITHDRAFT_117032 [Guillardia theta CCMP2712]|eukprot:XP_005823713.1 hypothetical protein GUITHDRAFT_117032 [Guillardia theta CCMP2712]